MAEYEKLFAESVQKKLKSIIIGKIFVCVTYNDELLVKIYKNGEVIFESLEPHFTKNLQNGMTSASVVKDILKQYKTFIHQKIEEEYFWQN